MNSHYPTCSEQETKSKTAHRKTEIKMEQHFREDVTEKTGRTWEGTGKK
jgi:hypothetical protein